MAALVGIAAHLRAIFAAHVPLQFVDWRRFRPTHDIKRDRLVSIATEAPDREIAVAGVECVAQRGAYVPAMTRSGAISGPRAVEV